MAYGDIPFRVRIGVTGHRTLADLERIGASVRDILNTRIWELFDRALLAKYRTANLAYTVLTPLAEGADRLVAREVLRFPRAEIEVVLPLAREDYLRDFAGAESKAEFEELCGKSRHVHSPRALPLESSGSASALEEERKRAYEEVGVYVVDQCDVLIAVWDGKPARGRGGTADIVAYARERKRPLIIVSADHPEQTILEKGAGLSLRAYDRIEMFNRFSVSEQEQRDYAAKMHADLFATPEGQKLSDRVKDNSREGLLPWYVRASLIAKRSQKAYFHTALIVYALTPLAVAAVAVGILEPDGALPAFLVEFLILLVIYGVLRVADRRKVHKKWVETRFLTERIRSAIFLLACGVKPSAVSLSPFTKPALRSDDWIVRTLAEIMARAGDAAPDDRGVCPDCVAFIRARWIGDQIRFHAAKAGKAGRLSRRLEKAGRAAFLAAIGASAWHLISLLIGHGGFLPALEKPAIFLAIILPALGAAIGGVRTHREYSRLEKRSQSMEAALRELDQKFAAVADFAELEARLQEADRMMLQETQDWMMLMRFAKVEAI